MKPLICPERVLLLALLVALAFACFGPFIAQQPHYHAFADQRAWHGLPHAMDVLSNLPFALAGLAGLASLALRSPGADGVRSGLAAVFFGGLVVTAVGSGFYHWQPDSWGLAWDRISMVVAFAGLLGMAAADRISVRAGVALALVILLAGPLAVVVWYTSANLLPWVVVQGGGMVLVVALAGRRSVEGAWGLPLMAIIACYTVAKLLEWGDHSIYAWTLGLVSGHSLKHVAAAMVAWPAMALMHNGVRIKQPVGGLQTTNRNSM